VIIKLLLGAWVDAGVIFGVVLLNSIIGFMQEGKALSALEALSRALTTETTVLRAGEKQRIDAKELVPGDIVLLASGDKVPADLRLLSSRSLQIDESALTGESLPVEKYSDVMGHDTALADRANMAYSSTLVTYGTAKGVVTGKGDDTEIGRISELIASAEVLATPLTRKIAHFSHLLLYAILGLATITFMVGLWHGDSWIDLFMAAVALSVAMIPEGLPAVLTITLAIGVARMAKRHAIIRRLPAVETLGSTTVICSDKTGTLTRNEMTVQQIWSGGENYSVSGVGYAPDGEIQQADKKIDMNSNVALTELLRAGLLCNDTVLKQGDEGWKVEGDPTEGALLVAARKADLNINMEQQLYPRLEGCQIAGLRVKMITGDHAITAATIARQIGLDETLTKGEIPKVLTGRELETMSDAELIQAATGTAVFARVTPEEKLRLVEALQAHGEVVAMTGDGVNDAPALRRADIGIAMGITGTEVSKEAADMVLTNDNFATIEAAVEEGRGVFDNLIKFLTWILPTNAGQGLVIIAAVMLSQPLPVLPVQALWINMTTAVLLGLALAFEPREPGIMNRPPRMPDTSLLSGELIFRIVLVGLLLLIGSFGLFEWALSRSASLPEARTIAVNVFAVGQSFYLLNCRSLRYSMFRLGVFSNPWIWGGIATMTAAQLMFTYLPLMNQLFHTAPIGVIDWISILAVGLVIYLIIGAEKTIRQHHEK